MTRKPFTLLFAFAIFNISFAQAPESMNYQTVIRDASGDIVANQNVSIRFKVRTTSSNGPVVYEEIHDQISNTHGLVNLVVGEGLIISGTVSTIDWASDSHYLEVELDITGGLNFSSMGVSQLISTPYSLHSKTSGSAEIAQGLIHGGTTDYATKFTGTTSIGNSILRDNGTALSVGTSPNNDYRFYAFKSQLTADGDGQAIIYAYRTRDSQNNGTAYGRSTSNNAIKGYNYWGDQYTFGVGGFSYNDYTRTGGVIGAYQSGTYWGSLGYKNSASSTYGVYATAALGTGTGLLDSPEKIGIGGGFFGDLIGSTSQGQVIGQLNSGELFAQYNKGNVYVLGQSVELIKTSDEITPVYTVSSTDPTIYAHGSTEFVNGVAYVEFDDKYQSLIGGVPIITATAQGECNGVYIASVDKKGFTLKELMNGTSNTTVSWIALGDRVDAEQEDLATSIVTQSDFDRNVQQVLYSDGNLEGKAKGIWWDGSTLQFGELPAHLATVKRESEE